MLRFGRAFGPRPLAFDAEISQRLSSTGGGSAEHQSDLEITWHIFKPPELPIGQNGQPVLAQIARPL